MLKLLSHGELCVCDIVAACDTIQPKVSFHLAALKSANLVKDRREGKWMHYSIDDSDLFKGLLILSVIEKIPEETVKGDRERLERFLEDKAHSLTFGTCCPNRMKGATG